MGRAPCCDKANVKRGPWSPEEDAKLKAYIEQYGTGGNWIALPQKIGLKRCGKSCRLRWLNYLRPNIKHGGFSEEEDTIICSLYMSIGSRWSIIAGQLPGRTDNDIKNYWNTKLKKKLLGKQRKDQRARSASSSLKREMMNRRKENFMTTTTTEEAILVYPPQLRQSLALPAVIQQQESRVDDQTVNIGGKLSDDHHQSNDHSFNVNHNSLYSCDISCIEGQTSSSLLNSYLVIANSNNNIPYYGGSFPFELNGMEYYYSNSQQLDNVESFSGMDMVNRSSIISNTSPENTSWGRDINSLVYSPMGFNYEICQQNNQLEDCTLEESNHFMRMQLQETALQ
ncbi:hypothetical protein ACH5RR_011576 [Cinchona calisaya]|uniref:Uncharacterized protein n=1 Tax=Cinchona calisaya TaxID=153742 RepID=A0ABD3A8W6_9GENT